MTQKAINRRNNRREAKRLRLQRAEIRSGRKVPNYLYDPCASQVPGHRNDLKPVYTSGRRGTPT